MTVPSRGLGALALALGMTLGHVAHAEGTTKPRVEVAREAGSLDALLARAAKSPGLSAQFTEEKQIALLAVPMRSSGSIHFAPGRGLVRHTTKPKTESVLVDDKELVLWDGRAVKRVELASSSTLETFARAFSYLLTANRAALEKSFTLTFEQSDAGDGFRLVLTPKNADLGKTIAAMEIEGRLAPVGVELSVLRVRETNGDVTTTRFSAVDAGKRYTPAELERIFRVPPATPPS